MSELQLTIETDNDAMQSGPEVADALRDVAEKVDAGHCAGRIRDLNGNTVGQWEVFDDAELAEREDRRKALALLDVFDTRQRSLLLICVQRYADDMRQACEEDQGIPEGAPGTVGNMLLGELSDVAYTLRTLLPAR